eukprot:scaffold62381_cov24-Tisochrysis_lutea.AAC.4
MSRSWKAVSGVTARGSSGEVWPMATSHSRSPVEASSTQSCAPSSRPCLCNATSARSQAAEKVVGAASMGSAGWSTKRGGPMACSANSTCTPDPPSRSRAEYPDRVSI